MSQDLVSEYFIYEDSSHWRFHFIHLELSRYDFYEHTTVLHPNLSNGSISKGKAGAGNQILSEDFALIWMNGKMTNKYLIPNTYWTLNIEWAKHLRTRILSPPHYKWYLNFTHKPKKVHSRSWLASLYTTIYSILYL